jgi:hypothetical protein
VTISYNTGTTADVNNAASISLTIPSGVLADDVMFLNIALFTEDSSAPAVLFSGGGGSWTELPSVSPQVAAASGIYSYEYIYYRVATSADPDASLTISETGSPSGSTWWCVTLTSYTGASTDGTIDVAGGTAPAGQTSTMVTFPAEMTSQANDWQILFSGGGNNGAGYVTPSGLTLRQNVQSSAGIYAVTYDTNAPAGGAGSSIGGQVFTPGAEASSTWIAAFTVGLASATTSVEGTASLSGSGTLAVLAVLQSPAALSGAGTMLAAVVISPSAALSGTGTLSAAGTECAGAALSGIGIIVAAATGTGNASFTGSGALTVIASIIALSVLTGTGTVTVPAGVSAVAGLSGAGALAGAAGLASMMSFSGTGTIAVPAVLTTAGVLTGTGVLTASASIVTVLSGAGSLITIAVVVVAVPLSGAGILTAVASFVPVTTVTYAIGSAYQNWAAAPAPVRSWRASTIASSWASGGSG